MVKNILVVIGPRRSGRTEVANVLKSVFPDHVQMVPYRHALHDYLKLHNIDSNHYFQSNEYEENRSLLMSYREMQWEKYLTLFSEDTNRWNNWIIDEVYYFSELKLLIQLGAKIIYVNTSDDKRKEMGLTKYMETQFYAQQVAAIRADEIKTWKKTIVIHNNGTAFQLGGNVRSLI